ncbi:SOS response-associated peptidase [Amycolatopsis cihanbeyliensis]|uniref:Abasic site processing protein n=1 Tax=Amycolatopsis cihanbeyliensis TaxID=1128664 RepID=A0A542DHK0_AMYCI|nr:SOS response-associated peptidase [Amycolatopsis cihanbeyliensis]TQJ02535.1 putative SOS response-associated peptidase YedK [Amycolatopsis cihanbeyliensis]
MCGRYAATKNPAKLAAEFDAVDGTEGEAPSENYNVAPTMNVLTVVQRHPRDEEGRVIQDEPAVRSVRVMRWGLVPFWAKDPAVGNRMINTRAESATEKPAFRKALSRRRCLIPADGWFEWRAGSGGDKTGKNADKKADKKAPKDPFFMTTRDGSSLAMAGLWETWRDPKADPDAAPLITCSVITTDAVGQLADIHHRMPLLMPSRHWNTWLDPDNTEVTGLLGEPDPELVDRLELRPVSTRVNNVRHNGPELTERVDPAPAELDGGLFDLPSSRHP